MILCTKKIKVTNVDLSLFFVFKCKSVLFAILEKLPFLQKKKTLYEQNANNIIIVPCAKPNIYI